MGALIYSCAVEANGDVLWGDISTGGVFRWSSTTQAVASVAPGIKTTCDIGVMVSRALTVVICMQLETSTSAILFNILCPPLATQPNGDIIVLGQFDEQIFRISPDGSSKVAIAGTGTTGYSGDGGLATSAQLNQPIVLAFRDKEIWFFDFRNYVIRVITADGKIHVGAVDGQSCGAVPDMYRRLGLTCTLATFVADCGWHTWPAGAGGQC